MNVKSLTLVAALASAISSPTLSGEISNPTNYDIGGKMPVLRGYMGKPSIWNHCFARPLIYVTYQVLSLVGK